MLVSGLLVSSCCVLALVSRNAPRDSDTKRTLVCPGRQLHYLCTL